MENQPTMPGFTDIQVSAINNKPLSLQERVNLMEQRIYQLEYELELKHNGIWCDTCKQLILVDHILSHTHITKFYGGKP